jgi:hypothetical protein
MGINNLAVQTFSSSGSQSVCRANKADSSVQITSDFISRCPIKYINGSGVTVIAGSLNNLPSDSTSETETFKIPNNVDAISDLILTWTVNVPTPATGTYFDCSGIYYSKTLLLDCINKIEIKHGSLIIQTLYQGDIYMRNHSELGYLAKHENTFSVKKNDRYVSIDSIIGHETVSGETLNFALSIPFIGRSSSNDRSLIQTGTFTNILSVVVHYNKIGTGKFIPLLYSDISGTPANILKTSVVSKLNILSHIITETEKNFMKQNIVNRVLNTSVGLQQKSIYSTISTLNTGITKIKIDLDSIDINVSHIMFCLNVNIFQGNNVARQFLTDNSLANVKIRTFKSLGGGPLDANAISSSWGEAVNDSIADISLNFQKPDVLGVFQGWLNTAELVLGNETTGEISPCALHSDQEQFSLKMCDKNFYILKLGDSAFTTAGVPFSRIKNKHLFLNVNNKFFRNSAFGTYSSVSSSFVRDPDISVTLCGTTLQIVNNNAVSFSYI